MTYTFENLRQDEKTRQVLGQLLFAVGQCYRALLTKRKGWEELKFLLLPNHLGHRSDIIVGELNFFFFFAATCISKEKALKRQNKRAIAHDGFLLSLLSHDDQVLSKSWLKLGPGISL